MEKVFWAGTHRVRTPEQTLAVITPLLAVYGITRLADVTGLDTLGVPVVMAVRPEATTLSVSQGKGATLTAAKVSAAMEAIELWHAEQAVPPPTVTATPATGLDLGYDIGDLEQGEGGLLTRHTRLDWIEARSAVNGRPTLAPRAAVHLGGFDPRDWSPGRPAASSNGLASGNTRAEALLHGLYEVIERDAVTRQQARPASEHAYLDLGSVTGYPADLVAQIVAAEAWLEVVAAPSRFGVPCFAAHVWREDLNSTSGGAGAHSDPAVALSRAVTEAAQSRLTGIVGSRDDLTPGIYTHPGLTARPETPPASVTWKTITASFTTSFATDDQEAAWLSQRVAQVSGAHPMVIDLLGGDISVVKVFCPGLVDSTRHRLARPATAGAR